VPYATAVGNHDGLGSRQSQTALFNQFFPVTNYQHLPTFGGIFESNRLDNSYHFFTAGGIDWLVLSLEFGPRDAVLDWANTVVTNFPDRRIIIVTHSHIFHDDTLHGSSPAHDWTPATYGRTNNGVEVWEKLIRRHANMTFVFNGHILGDGQGRLVGIGDHGNPVYQMLCNYQMKANGGAGFLRYLTFFPEEDRFEAKSYSPFLNRSLIDPANEFEYSNLGIFSNTPPPYLIDPGNDTATIGIFSDEIDSAPPQILSAAAFGNPAEITVLFDEVVEQTAAEGWTNYSINSTVPIISAALASDYKTVVLTCQTSLVPMATYTLTVTGIKDVSPFENEITTPVSHPFLYSPVLLDDDFTDFNFDGWTIVDEGTNGAPSIWSIVNGRMFQYANIHTLPESNSLTRPGTFAYWDKLRFFSWNNYVASVTLKNTDDDGIGFMFRYQNQSNYYKLDLDAQHTFRRLTKMVEGVETQLAFENAAFPVNRDVQLRVNVYGHEIIATLDGSLLFGGPITDDALTNGTIALYAWGSSGASFDNVLITLSNSVPQVAITAPSNNTTFTFGAPITFTAEATDSDSPIAYVEFFHGNVRLRTITNAPYRFIWTNVPAGNQVVTARATDIFDAAGNSDPLHFQIGAAPPQFVRQPQDRIAHMSQSVFFNAKVTGTPPLSYQWLFNGIPITNATAPVLILNNVEENRAGIYALRVQSPEVTVLSSPASLEIVPEENPPFTNSIPILRVEDADFSVQPVFSVVGPPGLLAVQFSKDLRGWTNLLTLTNTTSRQFFDDLNPARERRFYRVISPP